ncbi:MAG TPA: hypothetical protein VMG10_30345 [Gemmataceae bacterium]|nr:hypothetical protein [Gemmataceae bacterium]
MAMTAPSWLTRRGVHLQASKDGASWLVYLDKEPQYLLMAVPVKGQLGCRITQTINGRRLDEGATYPSVEAALQGGLEELRKALGW